MTPGFKPFKICCVINVVSSFLKQREGSWGVVSERISFGSFNFVVSYHHLRTRRKSIRSSNKQAQGQFLLECCRILNVISHPTLVISIKFLLVILNAYSVSEVMRIKDMITHSPRKIFLNF